jgi:hypothetical protein
MAEPLWDRATHDALVKATAPKRDGIRVLAECKPNPGHGDHGSRCAVERVVRARYA